MEESVFKFKKKSFQVALAVRKQIPIKSHPLTFLSHLLCRTPLQVNKVLISNAFTF